MVKTITDNTHFDAYSAPQFSASGATATKDSTVFVVPAAWPGYYAFTIMYNPRSGAGAIRETNLLVNGFDKGSSGGSNNNSQESIFGPPISGAETAYVNPVGPIYMNAGDYCQLFVYQDSGGALDNAADLVGYPFTMWRAGV